MARKKIGAVYMSKEKDQANYIKIDLYNEETITLKQGQYINVESKKYQLASLQKALSNGLISEENAEKARVRIENMKDFVLGELILVTK